LKGGHNNGDADRVGLRFGPKERIKAYQEVAAGRPGAKEIGSRIFSKERVQSKGNWEETGKIERNTQKLGKTKEKI